MVRNFKSKNLRGQWSLDAMKLAVAAVTAGGSLKSVARQYSVPRNTLRRKIAARSHGQEVRKQLGKATVLSTDQENELVEVILSMEKRLFGLTLVDLRRLKEKQPRAASKRSKKPMVRRDVRPKKKRSQDDDDASWFCFICGETSVENMTKCIACDRWIHDACADQEGVTSANYVCDECTQ